jgi:hypothetical protein
VQDPAVQMLVVIPRVARIDPSQLPPGAQHHRIRAIPGIHPGSLPDRANPALPSSRALSAPRKTDQSRGSYRGDGQSTH